MGSVLLIDDDRDFAEAVGVVLRHHGHTARVAYDTKTAMNELENSKVDLVLLDVMFPEGNTAGFELARRIRQRESLTGLSVIVLSGINRRLSLDIGPEQLDDMCTLVQGFLEKPVDFNVLVEKVNQVIASKERSKASGF